MDLDRGALANLDRRLLAGLNREERFQMVRLPVSPAMWSTWRRYCSAAGISMGRAIVTLIDRELASVADVPGDDSPVLARRAREQLAIREAEVASREHEMAVAEQRLRSRNEQLRRSSPLGRRFESCRAHWLWESQRFPTLPVNRPDRGLADSRADWDAAAHRLLAEL